MERKHFIIKESAKEFEGESNRLEENTEKYKTSSLSIIKVKRVDKNYTKKTKTKKNIPYKVQFSDSC